MVNLGGKKLVHCDHRQLLPSQMTSRSIDQGSFFPGRGGCLRHTLNGTKFVSFIIICVEVFPQQPLVTFVGGGGI